MNSHENKLLIKIGNHFEATAIGTLAIIAIVVIAVSLIAVGFLFV